MEPILKRFIPPQRAQQRVQPPDCHIWHCCHLFTGGYNNEIAMKVPSHNNEIHNESAQV